MDSLRAPACLPMCVKSVDLLCVWCMEEGERGERECSVGLEVHVVTNTIINKSAFIPSCCNNDFIFS